ncbi:MAG: 3-deoxy-manno-octulosonate cytidylyltransferase [Gemmatimonadales bacterium]|nr:MAG: 3-deoxy-manno-octulosonate cytidylyltransferase [Gemmatimonadales bacterium]
MTVLCVLPARIGSRRIPRKPLQIIAGRPLIEWTWQRAMSVPCVDRVVVATDSDEIAVAVSEFGGEVCLTSTSHASGTDRVAEVLRGDWGRGVDVVVNFQADEPFLTAEAVCAAVDAVRGGVEVATLAAPIRDVDEWQSTAIVKVARAADGRALYFSRAAIPHARDGSPAFATTSDMWLRHIGLYAYTAEALEQWVSLPESALEQVERLEQLRALEAGLTIDVRVVVAPEAGIDVSKDLERAERLLNSENKNLHGIQESHD